MEPIEAPAARRRQRAALMSVLTEAIQISWSERKRCDGNILIKQM